MGKIRRLMLWPAVGGVLAASGVAIGLVLATPVSAAPAPGVTAWGADATGQLAQGLGSNDPAKSTVPLFVSSLANVVDVQAGNGFALALLQGGTVMAWGTNSSGQLGSGKTPGQLPFSDAPVMVQLPAGEPARQIQAGGNFGLALLANDTVWAWGNDEWGQLGQNSGASDPAYSDVPLEVANLSGVMQISAGGNFALALNYEGGGPTNGAVMAWGCDCNGQLGQGLGASDPAFSDKPLVVSGGITNNVIAVFAGDNFALALMGGSTTGTVDAWGNNTYGQLGDGTTTSRDIPTPVVGLSGVRTSGAVLAAGNAHSLAVLESGQVMAWGADQFGQLGDNKASGGFSTTPIAVPGVTTATDVSAGGAFSLALNADFTVSAFGANNTGQLGDGTTTERDAAIVIPNLRGVHHIKAGDNFGLSLGTVESPIFKNPTTSITGTVGQPLIFQFGVNSLPFYATMTETGALPAGVTFKDNGDDTANLSGVVQPGAAGVYPITVTAANGIGTPTSLGFTITVH